MNVPTDRRRNDRCIRNTQPFHTAQLEFWAIAHRAQIDRGASTLSIAGQLARAFDAGSLSGLFTFGTGYQFALSGDEFATNNAAFAVAGHTRFATALRPLANSGFDVDAGVSLVSVAGLSIAVEYTGLWGENGQEAHEITASVTVAF